MTFLRWHLGLGDAIVCNAIVRHFAKDDDVTIPVYAKNLASVGQMFSDLKNISVLVVDSDNYRVPSDARIVSLGYFGRNFNPERWDESMYLQCGLDPALRHGGFYAPHDDLCEGVAPSGEYCFAESLFYRDSGALILSKIPINHAFPKGSIFWWRKYIENATEIECCDCGMLNLIESLETRATRFVLHDVRTTPMPVLLKKPWLKISYANKKPLT